MRIGSFPAISWHRHGMGRRLPREAWNDPVGTTIVFHVNAMNDETNKIKIRARMRGEIAEIRLLIPHPMESGRRKDASGQPIPARFIQTMTVDISGRRVVDAQLSGSISRDPYFIFKVGKVGAGETVTVRWQDNTGASGEGLALIE